MARYQLRMCEAGGNAGWQGRQSQAAWQPVIYVSHAINEGLCFLPCAERHVCNCSSGTEELQLAYSS